MEQLLSVRNLRTQFRTQDGVVKAVDGVSFEIGKGETLGVVGESGCGKSVTALSIMRLVSDPPGRIVGGEIIFDGRDLLKLKDEEMRKVRGRRIAMIFQDPMTSLNPVLTISRQLTEALELHLRMSHRAAKERAIELLDLVGIPAARARIDDYPHQFSGGMRQRVMIAMALSCNPELLIADEPTTALDVTIQAQIIDLIKKLSTDFGTAVMFISHNLGVVAGLCDRINVMYAGHVVETAATDELFAHPKHPYTLGLLRSIPRLDEARKEKLVPIEGLPPDLINPPAGCPFSPRCTYRVERSLETRPELREVRPGHAVACHVDIPDDELDRAPMALAS
ncbi:MAG: ABC transporter ATP-binding protein [Chloroflexi bacterium]|nr:ABC transporter ATP-binding protein [Chloroflexota bacterium]